jgi:hypothetical protein
VVLGRMYGEADFYFTIKNTPSRLPIALKAASKTMAVLMAFAE